MAQQVGILDGRTMLLYIDGVAIAGTTGHSMGLGVNMRDATTKDSSGKEAVLPGVSTATIGFDYMVAFDATYGIKNLVLLYVNKTKVALRISSEISGDQKYKGDGYLESLDTDFPNNDNITGSGAFHVTNGITPQTIT